MSYSYQYESVLRSWIQQIAIDQCLRQVWQGVITKAEYVVYYVAEASMLAIAFSVVAFRGKPLKAESSLSRNVGKVFSTRPWIFWLTCALLVAVLTSQIIELTRTRTIAEFIAELFFPALTIVALLLVLPLRAANGRRRSRPEE